MSIDDQSNNAEPIDGDAENQMPFNFDELQNVEVQDAEESVEAEQEVEQAIINVAHRRKKSDELIDECYNESDLVERAKKIALLEGFNFPHIKPGNPKDPTDIGGKAIASSDVNRLHAFDILFAQGSGRVPYPHIDEFSGRMVDHHGRPFGKSDLRVREIIEALDAAGLTNPTAKAVTDSYRDWAREHSGNSLLDYFERSIKEWDGESRLECLVELFGCEDNPLNRQVSKYFWLSLYNRIVNPGANVPISLALIGGQDAGKSFFSIQLCWYLMGNRHAAPVPLDFAERNYGNFLRKITGKSIIANVGEMVGFKKADINRIKDFVTQATDEFDFKFEDSITKPRQWITIMDGNSYDGLQRDDTGNRRFYPMFVGQVPDENGQPTWLGKPETSVHHEQFSVDYTGFEEKIWLIMGECRAWMKEHGANGYATMLKQTSNAVSKFSIDEMERARGVIKDEGLEDYLKAILVCMPVQHQTAYNAKIKGAIYHHSLIKHVMKKLFNHDTWGKTMGNYMKAIGFVSLGTRGFIMPYPDEFKTLKMPEIENELRFIAMVGYRTYTSGQYDREQTAADIQFITTAYSTQINKLLAPGEGAF
ncbi:primase superfamily helicase [Serratia phage MTx]|uniref:Primase superfamily helicase n=1 Tax=Serratia phage MTx TaxID=2557553 RepID=A0A482MGM3_9CAUD|nr:DNA primase [Serratia phage MTx]QBQ72408.1 primase superfamily helicase [Serratia phage MTx]